MLPRRRNRQTPDPPEEREMPGRRGKKLPDPPGARDVCDLCARMDAMEIAQRRAVGVGDISESESEDEAGHGG
jgi:hypothetical protein